MKQLTILQLGCSLFFVCLTSCANVTTSNGGIAQIASRFRPLNESSAGAVPGTVYFISRDGMVPILDMLAVRPKAERGSWLNREDGMKGWIRKLGTVRVTRKRALWSEEVILTCWLEPTHQNAASLGDPFACLDIVNRPLTGLIYNRDADLRIAQWRAALASAIATARSGQPGRTVAMCTGVQEMTSGTIALEGEVDASTAEEVTRDLLHRSHVDANWRAMRVKYSGPGVRLEIPIRGHLLISAQFRRLSVVDSGIIPYVAFSLGAVDEETVFPENGTVAGN